MVGLDNAGKTTILYQFLMNEVVHTSPTIGSNVEEVVWKNIHFLVWDLAGKFANSQFTNATKPEKKTNKVYFFYLIAMFDVPFDKIMSLMWDIMSYVGTLMTHHCVIRNLFGFFSSSNYMKQDTPNLKSTNTKYLSTFLSLCVGQQSLRTAWSTYYTNTEVSESLLFRFDCPLRPHTEAIIFFARQFIHFCQLII